MLYRGHCQVSCSWRIVELCHAGIASLVGVLLHVDREFGSIGDQSCGIFAAGHDRVFEIVGAGYQKSAHLVGVLPGQSGEPQLISLQ